MLNTSKKIYYYHIYREGYQRSIIRYTDADDLNNKMNLLNSNKDHKDIYKGVVSNSPNIVFVYSGMGSEWIGMGKELYHTNSIFKKCIEHVDAELKKHISWSLVEELLKDNNKNSITNAEFAQVANFAIQLGLTEMWKSIGVYPSAVIGHSYGEVMAFYTSGILSFSDAIKITSVRGKYQKALEGKGRMLVINDNLQEVINVIKQYNQNVSVAAINSCNSIVISGGNTDINYVHEKFLNKSTFLSVNVPYHSPLLKEIDEMLFKELESISYDRPIMPVFSTVLGKQLDYSDLNASYTMRNSQQCVLFNSAINDILNAGYYTFLEVGPHPVLLRYINEIMSDRNIQGTTFYSMRRGANEWKVFEKNLFELYCSGININWFNLNMKKFQLEYNL